MTIMDTAPDHTTVADADGQPVSDDAESQAATAGYPCPDCDREFDTPVGLGAHRYHAHGYVSPARDQRAAQPSRNKGIRPQAVKELDSVLEQANELLRAELLKILASGTEVGRLTTENIQLKSAVRQAQSEAEKLRRRVEAKNQQLKAQDSGYRQRALDAEKQWNELEHLIGEIVHIIATNSPMAATAAITRILPTRFLPAQD